MSNTEIFIISSFIGLILTAGFNYSIKRFINKSAVDALNYAVALISGIAFLGLCFSLYHIATNHLIYLDSTGIVYPGLYLGLSIFETYELIHMKKFKGDFSAILHHFFFITLVILICYDGKVHYLIAVISLQAITNALYHVLIATPYSKPSRKFLSTIYKSTFIIFRIIGITLFNILFFFNYSEIYHNSNDTDLIYYMPILLILSLLFNYYWLYLLIKSGWQIKCKSHHKFIGSPPSI
jgi:hypothetical protein